MQASDNANAEQVLVLALVLQLDPKEQTRLENRCRDKTTPITDLSNRIEVQAHKVFIWNSSTNSRLNELGYGMPAPNPAHYAYNNGQPLHGHPQQQYPNMQQAPYPPVGMQHVPQPQGQAAGYYQNGPPPQQSYAPPQQQGPSSYQQPPSGGYAQQPPQQYAGHANPAQGLAAAPGLVGGVYLSHSANAALPGAPVDPELLQAKHVIDQNPHLAEDLETEVHQMQVLQQVKDMNAAAEQAILKESKKKGKKDKKDKKGKSKSRRRRSRSRSRSDDSDSYDSDSTDSD